MEEIYKSAFCKNCNNTSCKYELIETTVAPQKYENGVTVYFCRNYKADEKVKKAELKRKGGIYHEKKIKTNI